MGWHPSWSTRLHPVYCCCCQLRVSCPSSPVPAALSLASKDCLLFNHANTCFSNSSILVVSLSFQIFLSLSFLLSLPCSFVRSPAVVLGLVPCLGAWGCELMQVCTAPHHNAPLPLPEARKHTSHDNSPHLLLPLILMMFAPCVCRRSCEPSKT